MRIFLFLSAFCVLLSSYSKPEFKNTVTLNNTTLKELPGNNINLKKWFVSLEIKEIEKLTGKKFTLKEKIGIKFLQHKTKKELKSKKEESKTDLGKTSMILGIIGLGLILIPYLFIASVPLAILAIILGNKARKADRNNRKAITGIILGWVTLGLVLLAFVLVLAVLSSWSAWG